MQQAGSPLLFTYRTEGCLSIMIILADIKKSQTVMDELASQCDFDLGRAARDSSWIKLLPEKSFMVLAGESSGGVFLAYGEGEIERRPVLYVSSEGHAGRIAANLTELIAMMLALPYWRDLLKFSDRGNLQEMRRTAGFSEQDFAEEYAEFPAARKRIADSLLVPAIADPVRLLHDCVHATDCSVVAEDGWPYESLFHHFKSSDNPGWT
ncbi:hypothetical protein BZG29_22380 [Janthinobacterium sp. LM6]|uniref:hypothetical protein n=1 Tax=Janthinobacterium sp. LM6 TaxID=1938606 RepID=UPI000983D27F|nr:hypothetical protein [Janthinobacterium sp. LM6]AQR70753.1 hypothetical protein BZG29_22380 [Janthinobacterium sp. LM6]